MRLPSGGGKGLELDARIPPPVIELAAGLLMWVVAWALPGSTMEFPGRAAAAGIVAALGIAMSVAGVFEFRRAKTTVNPLRPERTSSLVARGIYRVTRNPMYVGMAVVLVAWGIWLGSPLSLLVLSLFGAYMTRFQILPEERALEAKFGETFRAYRGQVRRWL